MVEGDPSDSNGRQQGDPDHVEPGDEAHERQCQQRPEPLGTAENPGLEIELKPTERLVDLRRDDIDLAIRYGDGSWPGLKAQPLTAARPIVVGAASLVGDTPPLR